jgi:hypothetical protein
MDGCTRDYGQINLPQQYLCVLLLKLIIEQGYVFTSVGTNLNQRIMLGISLLLEIIVTQKPQSEEMTVTPHQLAEYYSQQVLLSKSKEYNHVKLVYKDANQHNIQ